MPSDKPVRLKQAATEFNVGVQTILDFLKDKGIDMDTNPNAKIPGEAYGLLIKEYASERELKNKANKTGLPGKEKRETISLQKNRPAARRAQDDDSDDTLLIETQVAPEEPAAKKTEPETPTGGVKVVGKIDISKLGGKGRKQEAAPAPEVKPAEETPAEQPAAKEEPKEAAPVAQPEAKAEPEAPAAEVPPTSESAPEVEAPSSEAEAPAPEAKKPEADTGRTEPEFHKTRFEKLSGPTVVGKIDLPVEKSREKRPVASSSDAAAKGKRKRKRIEKPGAPGGAGGNRPGGGAGARGGANAGGNRGKVQPRQELTEAQIQEEVRKTLSRLQDKGNVGKGSKFRKDKRQRDRDRAQVEQERQEAESSILKITEFVTVGELASLMNVTPTEVISACMSLGLMTSINQRLDAETINIIAEEFGFEVNFTTADIQESITVEEDDPATLEPRAPIVTVMGHVDHGKTSLLDYVRKENVIAGEAGGITQHIGAYNVALEDGRRITFLDTPGHEAFTAMRARGAQVTDLAIIVIAADDSVMPQTREAINHAQAAGIPMVFAFNKIDKPGANPEKIREQLSQMNILVEEWGGSYQSQEISAKSGKGVDDLLEKVLIQAELMDLKANPNKRAHGTLIESSLDKGRGYVSNLLVEAGTLHVGDALLVGHFSGKVKAMFNERGLPVKEAGPSFPVSILGLNGAPNAGDKFYVMEDEREARQLAARREQLIREQGVRARKHITLDEIGRRLAIGDFQELNIIVKGDVDGSIEALSDSLQKLSTEKIQVNVIHKAVGAITESDVMLASASDAIIVGFQVRPTAPARRIAEQEEIQIKLYSVIYAAIEEVKDAMEGMLRPTIEEKVMGNAEVRDVFKISKVGTVAGCFVTDGKLTRNSKVRVIRDGIVLYDGELGSLKRFKDDVKEVNKGFECGLNIERFNDLKVGDIIEAYEMVEVKQTL